MTYKESLKEGVFIRGLDIKRLRKEHRLTQKQLANALDITKQFVSAMERGKKSVPENVVKGIAATYGDQFSTAKVEAKIDFLRIRFKSLDVEKLVNNFLRMDLDAFAFESRGFYHYTQTYSYGDIRIFRNPNDVNMGIMLDLSGRGCREFEEILCESNRTWISFFYDLYEIDIFEDKNSTDRKITRIDVALDELIDEVEGNYSLHDLNKKVEDELVIMRFKDFEHRGGRKKQDGEWVNKGLSLYFGSRKSPLYFCFYEKDYDYARKERISIEEAREIYQVKNRYEIRFKDEKAMMFVQYLLSSGLSLGWIVQEVVNYQIEVRAVDNSDLRMFCPDWERIMGRMEGVKLVVQPEKPTLDRLFRWIKNFLAPMLKVAATVDIKREETELIDIIQNAELKEKHEELIEMVCAKTEEILYQEDGAKGLRDYLDQTFGLSEEIEKEIEEYAF